MGDFRIFTQLLILLLFSRLLYQHLKHSSSIWELISLALFFLMFCIAGTFEELVQWVKGIV